jgi:hypothetical protein
VRSDFCAFILTHGRADRVYTYDTLKESGYTGKIYIVIDDEDSQRQDYIDRFGDKVLIFSKSEIAKTFDEGDNFGDRRAIIYARNVCFELAKQVSCRYFIQLDDDYMNFYYRFDGSGKYSSIRLRQLDKVLTVLVDYMGSIPALSIAMSQGGDHMGGGEGPNLQTIKTKRKAMNTFICDIEKPFQFIGRINEDVNTYTNLQRRGELFLSIMSVQVNQKQTQSNEGGMTDIYLDSGTYVKSFYSVMYSPSCVKIGELGRITPRRIHHRVKWNAAAPKIIHEKHKK